MATVQIDSTDFTVYASIADADAYALGAIHAETWRSDDTDNTTKAMALVTATRLLDRQSWVGQKADADQELAWPRTGVSGYDDDEIPQKVIDASIELAFALVDGSSVQDDASTAQTIQSLKAGSVAISYFRGAEGDPAPRFPQIVMELLRGLLADGTSFLTRAFAYGTDGESVTGNTFDLNDAP